VTRPPAPDFAVIGVPKAGTTALYAALVQHPDLFLPAVKEPKHFLSDGPPPTRGGPGDAQTFQEHIWRPSEYQALFASAPEHALRGEATPFYLYDVEAQRRLHALRPDARLIVVLRDPVERAHSNWQHLWSDALEPESDFVTACARELRRKEQGYDSFWHYISLGLYGQQLEHLFTLYPREQVLLLRYRDLRDSPQPTLDRVCRFLGVSEGVIHQVPHENVTNNVQNRGLNRLLLLLLRFGARIGYRFPVAWRDFFSQPLLRVLHRDKRRRPRLTSQERAAVLRYFVDDIALLERVTGLDYQDWLKLEAPALAV
jgi:Sulfotransferase family